MLSVTGRMCLCFATYLTKHGSENLVWSGSLLHLRYLNLTLQNTIWVSTSELFVWTKFWSMQIRIRCGTKYDILRIVYDTTLQFLRAMEFAGAGLFSKSLFMKCMKKLCYMLFSSYLYFCLNYMKPCFRLKLFLFLFTLCLIVVTAGHIILQYVTWLKFVTM